MAEPTAPFTQRSQEHRATRDKILGAYKKTAKPGEVAAVVMDETNAYYAEQVLGNKYTLEKLLEAEPTLKDKILSFFKGASTDYADVPKLAGAAKKYYKTYKKLFDEFSARNVESNATENAHLSTLFAENAQKTSLTNMNQENMKVSGRDYAVGKTKDGIKYVKLEDNAFKNSDGTDMTPMQAYNSLVGKKIALEDGDVITFIKKLPGRNIYKELFKKLPGYEPGIDVKAVSENINKNIVEVIEASDAQSRNEPQKHLHIGITDFDTRSVYITDGNNSYRVELNIANLTDGTKIACVKRYIENASREINEKIKKAETAGQTRLNQPSNGSISQKSKKSNSFDKKTSDRQDTRHYALDIEYRQDMAHDIAEYIVAKVLMDSKTENPDALEDVPSSRGRNQEEKLILRSNFTLVN